MLLRGRCQEVVHTWSRLGPVLEEKTKVQLSYSPLTPPWCLCLTLKNMGSQWKMCRPRLSFGSFLRLLTWGGWMGVLRLSRRQGRPSKEMWHSPNPKTARCRNPPVLCCWDSRVWPVADKVSFWIPSFHPLFHRPFLTGRVPCTTWGQ